MAKKAIPTEEVSQSTEQPIPEGAEERPDTGTPIPPAPEEPPASVATPAHLSPVNVPTATQAKPKEVVKLASGTTVLHY